MKGSKDIYKLAKGFDKNPQNINKKGRPRKTWTTFNDKCKKKGLGKINRETYFETIENLMKLNEEELLSELADKENPQWIRWLIQDLGNKQIRAKIMTDYRDWMFGKADQKIEITQTPPLLPEL